MKVFTYYEEDGGPATHEIPLIEMWEESWRLAGWQPVILGIEVARRHPLWNKLNPLFESLPTINNKVYETACYRRWIAMAVAGGGIMSDIDVINYSLAPQDVAGDGMRILSDAFRPCIVSGTEIEYLLMAFIFSFYSPDGEDTREGKPHCSDQNILARLHLIPNQHGICADYGAPGWETSPTVHFSNTLVKNPRCDFIRTTRPYL